MTRGAMIKDVDYERSLDAKEAMLVYTLYMNDIADWMRPVARRQYNRLTHEAKELVYAKRMRGCSSMAKRKGGHGDKGSAAKPVRGLRQRAQRMKKQLFEEMIRNFAVTKAFSMALVRHPKLMSADGLEALVEEWREVKASNEYQDMMRVAPKKRNKDKELKRKRDEARTAEAGNPVMEAWMRLKQ